MASRPDNQHGRYRPFRGQIDQPASTTTAPHGAPTASDQAAGPLSGLLASLHSNATGLSSAIAAAILQSVGPNRIDSAAPRRLLAAFIGRFSNPLIMILLAAAGVSAFTGDVASFGIIASIVLVSVVLDVVQEHRAENAAERLRDQVSLQATALRDGRATEVPSAAVVPGDVVLLTAGDLVPADCRLI